MKQVTFPKIIFFYMMMIAGITSCKKQDMTETDPGNSISNEMTGRGFAENDMVMYWNQKTSTVLANGFTPPAQSRYFAMVQIAVHDALNSIKPKFERFALLNERRQFASPDAAVASAAYWTIKKMNVHGSFPIDTWYAESLHLVPEGESKESGKTLGELAADAIIAKRANDNFAQANAQLPVPDGISAGAYRSTLPFSNPGMPPIKALHQWGALMQPFVTQSNSQFRPEAPLPIMSAAYVSDYNEVKAKGASLNHTRTNEETEIGVFWVERSTTGWNRFARNILSTKKIDAWRTARLFALVHTAMIDGVSGCFEAKYHYFYWRPETGIRINDDGNPLTSHDAGWLPSYIESPNLVNPAMNMYTPPIPDYPSAHANFGGAAAEILKLFFESDNISVNQTSGTLPTVTRPYTSISRAARDNSLSRIYVGFHFRDACLKGEDQGKRIASYVFNNAFRESTD